MPTKNTSTLSTRLNTADIETVRRLANSQGLSLSAYTKKAIVVLSAPPGTPDDPAKRRNVCSALGLSSDASDDDIVAALTTLLDADTDPAAPADPLQSDAEPTPAKLSAGAEALPPAIASATPEVQQRYRAVRAERAQRDATAQAGRAAIARTRGAQDAKKFNEKAFK